MSDFFPPAEFPIPPAALDGRLAIVGTSGSGKSTTAKGAVEALLKAGRRVCIVDVTDVWFGLRLTADRQNQAFPLAIFGGRHSDMKLTDNSGTVVGQAVAQSSSSCIVSVSEFDNDEIRREFALDFFTALYQNNRAPIHLVIDEADFMAPQQPASEGPSKELTNRIKEITSRGRVRGFRTWIITQRTAKMNKDILTLAETMVAMQMIHPLDRNTVKAWISDHADQEHGKSVLAALPTLQRGQGIVWSPRIGMLKTVQFPLPNTYDSMRTPEYGEEVVDVELGPIDLGDLSGKMAKVEAELRANDPAELRARLEELRQEKTKGSGTATKAQLEEKYQEGLAAGIELGLEEARKLYVGNRDQVRSQIAGIGRAVREFGNQLDRIDWTLPVPNIVLPKHSSIVREPPVEIDSLP